MKKIAFVAAALALLAMSSAAQAQNLPPNSSVTPAADAVPATATLVGQVTGTFNTATGVANPPSGATGSYVEDVYQEGGPGGTLDFVYQFKVDAGTTEDIQHITSGGFGGKTIDAEQTANGALPAPFSAPGSGLVAGNMAATTASRTLANNGDIVSFNFPIPNNIVAGGISDILIFRTDATSFEARPFGITDSLTVNVPGLAPTPEPASLVLFGGLALGLGGAGLRRWRQRKTVIA